MELIELIEQHFARLGTLHVEEDLEARVEAVIGDLLPDLAQLLLVDLVHLHLAPPAQRVEQLHRKLLRLRHPCIPNSDAVRNCSNWGVVSCWFAARGVEGGGYEPMHSGKSSRER
jgi:hypothetical protein